MPFSSFDIFCFEFQRAWNWFFFFLKKRNFPYQFFLFTLLRNHQILEQVETIILWKNNLRAHRVDFAAFSCTIRNWWEKPCISHVVKFTTRWVSDGGKVPILWGKNGYQLPGLFQFDGFHCILSCYGKLMEKPIYFTYYKVYHRMWIWWEKITHTLGKVCVPIFPVHHIRMVL